MSQLFFFSRPLGTEYTNGTGEQMVANEIHLALKRTGRYTIKTIKRNRFMPSHGSSLSILYYDVMCTLWLTIRAALTRADCVFINSPFQALWGPILKLSGITTVLLIHDLFYLEKQLSPFNLYARYAYYIGIRSSSHIVATSAENQKQILDRYGIKSTIINPGLSGVFASHKKLNHILLRERVKISYVGAYVARKRPHYWIKLAEAFSNNAMFNVELCLAGTIPDEVARQIQNKASKNVKINILGKISETEKYSMLSGSNYLFSPTSIEGFGIPLVEAARVGALPIVLTDSKLPKVISDLCLHIESCRDFTELIEQHLRNPQAYIAAQLKSNELSHAFSYNRFAEYLEQI